MVPRAPSRAGFVVLSLLAAAALVALALLDPVASRLFPPCPFRLATGLLCPVCGTGRALHALLGGRVADALRANAATVVAAPLLLVALAAKVVHPERPLPRLPRALSIALLLLLAAFLVARNVFPALAPR